MQLCCPPPRAREVRDPDIDGPPAATSILLMGRENLEECTEIHSRLVSSADGDRLLRWVVDMQALARGHGIAAIRQTCEGVLAGTVRGDSSGRRPGQLHRRARAAAPADGPA